MAKTVKPLRIEKDVKKRVKDALTKHNWFWWMPAANAFGRAGTSDFCALRAGVFLAVETKIGKNPLSPMQHGFLQSIEAESGFAFVVNDQNIETFEHWLEVFDRARDAQMEKKDVAPEDGAFMIDAMRAMTHMIGVMPVPKQAKKG